MVKDNYLVEDRSDREVLLKIHRQFSHSEAVKALEAELAKRDFTIGELKSELAEKDFEISKLKDEPQPVEVPKEEKFLAFNQKPDTDMEKAMAKVIQSLSKKKNDWNKQHMVDLREKKKLNEKNMLLTIELNKLKTAVTQ
jgi:hypothetical protein